MRIPRIYQAQPLAANQTLQLCPAASQHVGRVLRKKKEQPLILFNGNGGEYLGVISEVSRHSVSVTLVSHSPIDNESNLKITLMQCISRTQSMDVALQKAVELGVTHIIPIISERTPLKLDSTSKEKKQGHWQRLIIGAAEQCGRTTLPELAPISTLEQQLQASDNSPHLLLDPRAERKINQLPIVPTDQLTVLIGPEGGLSDHEIAAACDADFITVKFGPRVLRTETAAAAFITAAQLLWGDMG